jgi:hypothetical protein
MTASTRPWPGNDIQTAGQLKAAHYLTLRDSDRFPAPRASLRTLKHILADEPSP